MILNALLFPAPRVMDPKHKVPAVILMIITITYMSIVHHAQLLYILLVMGFLLLGGIMSYRREMFQRLPLLLVSFIIPIASICIGYMGSVVSIIKNRFLANVLSEGFTEISTQNPGVENPVITTNVDVPGDVIVSPSAVTQAVDTTIVAEPVLTTVSTSLFDGYLSSVLAMSASVCILVFGLVGIYYMVTHNKSIKRYFILLPLLLILFVIFVPGVIDILPYVTRAFQIYRLRYVLVIFFVVAMAVGCWLLLNNSKSGVKKISSQIIAVILSILLIISSPGASALIDNDVFMQADSSTHYYFTEAEIALLERLPSILPSASTITSEKSTVSYLDRTLETNNKFIQKNIMLRLFSEGDTLEEVRYVIFTAHRLNNPGIDLFVTNMHSGGWYEHVDEDNAEIKIFYKNIYGRMKIYDNKDDMLYLL